MLAFCFFLFPTAIILAQEAADYFRQNCYSCHTIGGGRLTGPDLKNVSERRDRIWLVSFITNPKAMIDSGDPYANKLLEEARGVVMTTIVGMTRERAESLLDFIDEESALETSQLTGLQISDEPFSPQDIETGYQLFTGARALKNGGPPCISCHTVSGISLLSGGRLGPDLSLVFERLQGRQSLAAWMMSPATPTMQGVFKEAAMQPDEILSLVAYMEDAAKKGGEDDMVPALIFILMGLAGASLLLIVFDMLWKMRFRAVRKPQVQAAQYGETQ